MAETPRAYSVPSSGARETGGTPSGTPGTDLVDTPPANPADNSMSTPAANPGSEGMVREAVAVFDSEDGLQHAIDELTMAGFGQHELSLMARDEAVRGSLGQSYTSVQQAKDDPDAPRQSIISPEEVGTAQGMAAAVPAYVAAIAATAVTVASGGTALAAAGAAVAAGGASGGIGALLASWIGGQRKETLQQQLDKGGILLWVNLRDPAREQMAYQILSRHSTQPVEIHDVPQTTGQSSV